MFVNTALLKHPMNYVIVTLMVLIAGIAAHLVLTHVTGKSPAANS